MDIAIAGAGIGGLASATFLARVGHRVTVFDQFDSPEPIGAGLMLQETGLAVLAELGLRTRMEALGAPIDRLYGLTQPSGRTVLDVRYKALNSELKGLGVLRSAIFDLLLEAAIEAGAELVPNTEIASHDDRYLVTESGGRLGPFDLVIDALGVRSPLSSDPKTSLPFGALWATLPWPKGGPFDATALEQRYLAARQMTGVMASGSAGEGQPETATYFWSLRVDDEAAWRSRPLEEWKTEAQRLWPETKILLDQITSHDQLAFARYRHRTHPRPVEGRLVHIGDAWHAASPQLGQGANMALLDAFALAIAMEMHADIDAALAAYVKLRRLHVRIYQLMTWMFTPVYQSDARFLPVLRDWLAAPLSRVPPAPMLLAAMVSGAVGRPLKRLGLKS